MFFTLLKSLVRNGVLPPAALPSTVSYMTRSNQRIGRVFIVIGYVAIASILIPGIFDLVRSGVWSGDQRIGTRIEFGYYISILFIVAGATAAIWFLYWISKFDMETPSQLRVVKMISMGLGMQSGLVALALVPGWIIQWTMPNPNGHEPPFRGFNWQYIEIAGGLVVAIGFILLSRSFSIPNNDESPVDRLGGMSADEL